MSIPHLPITSRAPLVPLKEVFFPIVLHQLVQQPFQLLHSDSKTTHHLARGTTQPDEECRILWLHVFRVHARGFHDRSNLLGYFHALKGTLKPTGVQGGRKKKKMEFLALYQQNTK